MKTYKELLTLEMEKIGKDPASIFVGQQVLFPGNPMSATLEKVNKNKIIELPVMEETQMGVSLGLAMTGKKVVTFYPRWDFLISATNQLVNHVDKFKLMTGKDVKIICRIGKGADFPLDPGHQHKGNYLNEYKALCPNITFIDLQNPYDIEKSYEKAFNNAGIFCLIEYPERYNDKVVS